MLNTEFLDFASVGTLEELKLESIRAVLPALRLWPHTTHGELEDLRFVTVHTALATLPMIDTTQFMLAEMQRVVVAGGLNAIKHTPFMFYRDDLPCVLYE